MQKYESETMVKKRSMIILCVLALLVGCVALLVSARMEQPNQAPLTLMDDRVPVGDAGNLYVIPGTPAEEMDYPQLLLMGQSMLLYATDYGMDNGGQVLLRRMNLRDGALLEECTLSCGGYVTVQANETGVGVCDVEGGRVTVYPESLENPMVYTVDDRQITENWYLGGDLAWLYRVSDGITALHLATGEQKTLLENVSNLSVVYETDSAVTLSGVENVTQRTVNWLLDFESGALQVIPVHGQILSAAYAGDTWLIGDGYTYGQYRLISSDVEQSSQKCVLLSEGRMELLPGSDRLLTADDMGRTLRLYTLNGGFLSECVLPDNGFYAGRTPIWSDLWNGYFLMSFADSPQGQLLFWDTQRVMGGADLPITDPQPTNVGGISAAPALYARARAMGEAYGIDIRIADQCQMDYGFYYGVEVTDSDWINMALDVLERGLSAYPDGFFRQLVYGSIQTVAVELVGSLVPAEGTAVDSVGAFTMVCPDEHLMVFDLYCISEDKVYHEVAHMIDNRLTWDASVRTDALFSEEAWMALNPEGFHYASSYQNIPDELYQYGNSGYFAYDYSLTFSTEDRATMMEMALGGEQLRQAYWNGLRTKLAYYSRCIRDCFDTTLWPEYTAWEAVLQ